MATKSELEVQLAQLQAELEAAQTTIAELKNSKKSTRKAAAPKELVHSNETVQNADYVGRSLTLCTPEEVTSAMEQVAENTRFPVYVNISGGVLVNGQREDFKRLMPVVLNGNGFLIYGTEDTVSPITGTFDHVRVVSIRDSVVARYYLGEKPLKKSDAAVEETADTEA